MKRLKLWVEREMHIRKWRESDFQNAAGISFGEVRKLFDDSPEFEKRMIATFKALRGIARAFHVPLESVMCEAELYSGDSPPPLSLTKLVEGLNEEQKELVGRLAKQFVKS